MAAQKNSLHYRAEWGKAQELQHCYREKAAYAKGMWGCAPIEMSGCACNPRVLVLRCAAKVVSFSPLMEANA